MHQNWLLDCKGKVGFWEHIKWRKVWPPCAEHILRLGSFSKTPPNMREAIATVLSDGIPKEWKEKKSGINYWMLSIFSSHIYRFYSKFRLFKVIIICCENVALDSKILTLLIMNSPFGKETQSCKKEKKEGNF